MSHIPKVLDQVAENVLELMEKYTIIKRYFKNQMTALSNKPSMHKAFNILKKTANRLEQYFDEIDDIRDHISELRKVYYDEIIEDEVLLLCRSAEKVSYTMAEKERVDFMKGITKIYKSLIRDFMVIFYKSFPSDKVLVLASQFEQSDSLIEVTVYLQDPLLNIFN